MGDGSREAWNAPRGIDGEIGWDNGNTSELHYARFVNGEERKAEYVEIDGVRYVPERTCEVVGEWEKFSQTQDLRWPSCSECGYIFGREERLGEYVCERCEIPNYCPDCGAKVVD